MVGRLVYVEFVTKSHDKNGRGVGCWKKIYVTHIKKLNQQFFFLL